MSNAIELTISDVKSFKSCRTYWDFNSSLRQNLTPKRRAAHFAFGDVMHEAFRHYYLGDDPVEYFREHSNELIKDVDPAYQGYEKLTELIDMGPKLLSAYVSWAKPRDNFEVIAQEERHVVRLNGVTPGSFLSFKFDMLIKMNGKHWLWDFKTTSQMPTDTEFLTVDDQAVAYQAAAEKHFGFPVAGIIYQYIRKKNPTVPGRLQNGSLSKRADIVTTVEVYRSEIERYGLDEADYEDVLLNIAKNEGKNFFLRTSATANKYQKEKILEQLAMLANMMGDPDVEIYPAPERTKCSICDFRNPCFIRQSGYNIDSVLKDDYRQNEPRD